MNLNTSIKGQYQLEIKKADGTIETIPWFDNIITNNGLDLIGQDGIAYCQYLKVGSGTAVPTVLDSDIQSQIGAPQSYITFTENTITPPLYKKSATLKYVFAQGTITGNISEVATGHSSGSSMFSIFSRSLIKDVNGNPISVSITAIDQLTVYYKITFVPVLTTSVNNLMLNSVNYSYSTTLDPTFAQGFGYNGIYSDSLSKISDGAIHYYDSVSSSYNATGVRKTSQNTEMTYLPYTSGSYTRKTLFTFDPNDEIEPQSLNRLVVWLGPNSPFASYNIDFTPGIPKLNTQTLSFTFETSWNRI